jgi:hypothetical protein
MNFAKLSNDELQDLLASKAVYAAEIEAELSVLSDEMVEIDMVLSDRNDQEPSQEPSQEHAA